MSSPEGNENNNQQIKKLPCDHIFHKSCLRSWFQRQQTCPTCRTSILRLNPTPAPAAAAAAANAQPNAAGAAAAPPNQAPYAQQHQHHHHHHQQQAQPAPAASSPQPGPSSSFTSAQSATSNVNPTISSASNSHVHLPFNMPNFSTSFVPPPFGKFFISNFQKTTLCLFEFRLKFIFYTRVK